MWPILGILESDRRDGGEDKVLAPFYLGARFPGTGERLTRTKRWNMVLAQSATVEMGRR